MDSNEMKKLILAPFLILVVFLTSCGIPSSVDREIKNLIKDIPIPARYNMDTGEKLVKYHVIVKEAEKFYHYSIPTGEPRAEYEIFLEYDMPFYVFPAGDKAEAYHYYLTFQLSYIKELPNQYHVIDNSGNETGFITFTNLYSEKTSFTINELKELSDNLTWEN